jgi:hypothetical protein
MYCNSSVRSCPEIGAWRHSVYSPLPNPLSIYTCMPQTLPSPAHLTTRMSKSTAWPCCSNVSSNTAVTVKPDSSRLANIDTALDKYDDLLDEQAHTISGHGNALDDHGRRLLMHKEEWESYQEDHEIQDAGIKLAFESVQETKDQRMTDRNGIVIVMRGFQETTHEMMADLRTRVDALRAGLSVSALD